MADSERLLHGGEARRERDGAERFGVRDGGGSKTHPSRAASRAAAPAWRTYLDTNADRITFHVNSGRPFESQAVGARPPSANSSAFALPDAAFALPDAAFQVQQLSFPCFGPDAYSGLLQMHAPASPTHRHSSGEPSMRLENAPVRAHLTTSA
jgi:hypothetical protein